MELTLYWRGPVGPGTFPEEGDALAALAEAGVYLRIKQYDDAGTGPRTVSYVGQSIKLIVRFDQHLRDILTFSSALRDPTGSVVLARDGANRYQAYNALDSVMSLVTAEAARIRFYWAACEDGFDAAYLNLIEGALKVRLEAQASGDGSLDCENIQGIGSEDFGEEIIVTHAFDALEPDHAVLLRDLLGSEALRLTVPLTEFDHVE